MLQYLFNLMIALDQLFNAVLGGDPDETISSRCAKQQHIWYWRVLGVILEFIDKGHLKKSLEANEGIRIYKVPTSHETNPNYPNRERE